MFFLFFFYNFILPVNFMEEKIKMKKENLLKANKIIHSLLSNFIFKITILKDTYKPVSRR